MRLIFVMWFLVVGVATTSWASEDTQFNTTGTWYFTWSGIPFAKLWIHLEEDNKQYALTASFKSRGLVRIFKKMKSLTTSQGVATNDGFQTIEFNYKNKDEDKIVRLSYQKDGTLTHREVLPEDDPDHRALVEDDRLKLVATPGDAIFDLRDKAAGSVLRGEDGFEVDFFDGKRLMTVHAKLEQETQKEIDDEMVDVYKYGLSRVLVDGFTNKELARYNEGEPPVALYLRKSDFFPVAMEVEVKLGTLEAYWEVEKKKD